MGVDLLSASRVGFVLEGSLGCTSIVKNDGIAISMNGKGRWRDNAKFEEVYLPCRLTPALNNSPILADSPACPLGKDRFK